LQGLLLSLPLAGQRVCHKPRCAVGANDLNKSIAESGYDKFCTAVKLVSDVVDFLYQNPLRRNQPRHFLSITEVEQGIAEILKQNNIKMLATLPSAVLLSPLLLVFYQLNVLWCWQVKTVMRPAIHASKAALDHVSFLCVYVCMSYVCM